MHVPEGAGGNNVLLRPLAAGAQQAACEHPPPFLPENFQSPTASKQPHSYKYFPPVGPVECRVLS